MIKSHSTLSLSIALNISAVIPDGPGVTGQSIPPAGLYPGLKRPRLDYTRVYYGLGQFIPGVYYGLGQFIPPQAKLYTHDINHDINSVERYTQELFNFSTSYCGFSFVTKVK